MNAHNSDASIGRCASLGEGGPWLAAQVAGSTPRVSTISAMAAMAIFSPTGHGVGATPAWWLTVVPGHGPTTDKAGVTAVKGYLEYIERGARRRFDAGMPMMEAAQHISLTDY
jgi:hypothetical protein